MDDSSNPSPVRRVPRHASFVAVATVAVAILGTAMVAVAGAPRCDGLSQELEARVSQYIDAWNTHDPAILAQFFTADADMIMGTGPILAGRTAIQDWWRNYFAVQEPERTLTIEVQSTREISTDAVVVNVRTTTGGRTAQGLDLPAGRARGTWVMVRRDGDWLISVIRGMPTQQDRIIRSRGGASSKEINQ